MLNALLIVLSIVLCLAAFDIIVLVGFLPQALFFIEQPLIIVKMKLGEGNNIFPIKPTFIYINFIPFIIYDK